MADTQYLDTRPYVGLSHTIQHINAGCLTDHHVSVPSAAKHKSAATAAALQPLDPPDIRFTPYGFTTGQYAEFSFDQPIANSSKLTFQIIHHHACSSFSKQVALYGGIYFSAILEPNVVVTHLVRIKSLIAIGAHFKFHSFKLEILFFTYSSAKLRYILYFSFSSFDLLRYDATTTSG
jgi:hypothetical protein